MWSENPFNADFSCQFQPMMPHTLIKRNGEAFASCHSPPSSFENLISLVNLGGEISWRGVTIAKWRYILAAFPSYAALLFNL